MKIKIDEGNVTKNPSQILECFVKYYTDIFNNYEHSNLTTQNIVKSTIPKLILQEDNKFLNKKSTLEEMNKHYSTSTRINL